jgi:hypothetical protein
VIQVEFKMKIRKYIFLFNIIYFDIISSVLAVEFADETKTHYGMGYEQRMIILENQNKIPITITKPSAIRVQKIERPIRPYRPQRPIRPGR